MKIWYKQQTWKRRYYPFDLSKLNIRILRSARPPFGLTASGSDDLLVFSLQIIESLQPLLDRQIADFADLHSPIQPGAYCRTAEEEVAAGIRECYLNAACSKFLVNALDRHPHTKIILTPPAMISVRV